MVARLPWAQKAVGSNPAAPTTSHGYKGTTVRVRYDVRNAALRGVFMHIEVAKRIVRTSPVSEPPHVSAMHLAVGEDTLADGFDLGQIDGCTAEEQLEVN